MNNIVTIGRACVLWAVLLWAVPVFGQGPLASTQKDAAKAVEEKKAMRLKEGASEHERAAWDKWLEVKPNVVKANRDKVKQADQKAKDAGSEQPQPDDGEEPAGEPDKR